MPGSGVPLLWTPGTPAEVDIADAAPIRSIVTSVGAGLAVEHNWPNASGANFGYHLLGSCRAHWDVESNVSSSGTDGRLMVTSDTSRFFHVGSAGTMLLGSQNVLSLGSQPVGGQRYYWAAEIQTVTSAGTDVLIFPNSGFSGVPFVLVSVNSTYAFPAAIITVMGTTTPTTVAIVSRTIAAGGTTNASGHTLIVMSIGTRVL